MKLYFAPGACSLASHIALQEAGLDYALERVDLRSHTTELGEDFYRINPKGYVPALRLDSGDVLTEGVAILQYVADLAPQSSLAPAAGTMARYRLQEWLTYLSSELHKNYGPLFNPAITEDAKQAQLERIGSRLEFIAKSLEGRDFLMGEHFTVADAYLFVMLNWSRGKGPDLARWPTIGAYFERLRTRPGVHAALVTEGLAKAS